MLIAQQHMKDDNTDCPQGLLLWAAKQLFQAATTLSIFAIKGRLGLSRPQELHGTLSQPGLSRYDQLYATDPWLALDSLKKMLRGNERSVADGLEILDYIVTTKPDQHVAYVLQCVDLLPVAEHKGPLLRDKVFLIRARMRDRISNSERPTSRLVLLSTLEPFLRSPTATVRSGAIIELLAMISELDRADTEREVRARLGSLYLGVDRSERGVPSDLWAPWVACLKHDQALGSAREAAFLRVVEDVCATPNVKGLALIRLLSDVGSRAAEFSPDALSQLMKCQELFAFHGLEYNRLLVPVGFASNGHEKRNGRVWDRRAVRGTVHCSLADGCECNEAKAGCKVREISFRGFFAENCTHPGNTIMMNVGLKLRDPARPRSRTVCLELGDCVVVSTHFGENGIGRGVRIGALTRSSNDRLFEFIQQLPRPAVS